MDLHFRQATKNDVSYLLDLRRSTMDEHLKKDHVSISDEEHLYRIHYNLDDARIVERDNRCVGMFKVSFLPDENTLYLYQLQIAPEFQGQGIGRQLVEAICRRADSQSCAVGLSVLRSNPAKALYERLGFAVVGVNAHEYEMRYGDEVSAPRQCFE